MKQPVPIFEGDVVNGKMKLQDHVRKAVALWVSTFKTGTHLDIIIRKHKTKRSLKQNAYYWSVVVPILADETGHDNPEDMHEDLKLKFNPVPSKLNPDKMIGGSTTKMSTEEFFCGESSYVERICRWAATTLGCYIPPPTEVDSDEA